MLEEEKKLIIKVLSEEKSTELLESWYRNYNNRKPMKSTKIALEFKEKGNEIYRKSNHNAENHEMIRKLYSLSIANAPPSSEELAVAYGNRSALLFHLKKHQDSIADIDRALEITKSNSLKIKLLSRKNQCFTALESIEEKLSYDMTKLNKSSVNKQMLSEFFSNQSCMSNLTSDSVYNNLAIDDFNELQELLAVKKICNPFDLVSLRYNEKYGRHLVAKQDIKPGEIIMVDQPFYKCVNLNTIYTTCSHCLKTSWATIPCDHCNLSMYCSEGCKKEAWKMYHDMECAVFPYIVINKTYDFYKQLALRSIITEIKKAESINKLRQDIKKLLSCDDKLHKGFVNEKFSNDQFISILSLTCAVDDEILEAHADQAVLTLITLIKSTSLFGKNDKFQCGQDLISNKDVIFIGTLLLRMIKITDINAYCVHEDNPQCRFFSKINDCDVNRCCEKGACLVAVPSFFNHSCNPNVKSIFTEDMHMVTYSLLPIKKNSQIFTSYVGLFFNKPLSDRKMQLLDFNFQCTDSCCKENWPEILKFKNWVDFPQMNKIAEFNLTKKYISLLKKFEGGNIKNPWSEIKNLSKGIEEACNNLTQPSYFLCLMISVLMEAFCKTYGYKINVPSNC